MISFIGYLMAGVVTSEFLREKASFDCSPNARLIWAMFFWPVLWCFYIFYTILADDVNHV